MNKISILNNLNLEFKLELENEYKEQKLDFENLQQNVAFKLPSDYAELTSDFIPKTFVLKNNRRFCVWSISEVISLNEDYHAQEDFPNSIIIGDNSGGCFYVFYEGYNGFGLYGVPSDDICEEEAFFISKSLTSLLVDGDGIDKLM